MHARRTGLVLSASAAVVLAAAGGAAGAAFADGAAASSSAFSATTLAPPTGLGLSTFCESGLLGLLGNSPVIRVSWTRSAQISGSTSPLRTHQVRLVVGSTTYDALTRATLTGSTVTTDVVGKEPVGGGTDSALAKGTSHQVQVRSQWGQWVSTPLSGSISTLSGLNLACL